MAVAIVKTPRGPELRPRSDKTVLSDRQVEVWLVHKWMNSEVPLATNTKTAVCVSVGCRFQIKRNAPLWKMTFPVRQSLLHVTHKKGKREGQKACFWSSQNEQRLRLTESCVSEKSLQWCEETAWRCWSLIPARTNFFWQKDQVCSPEEALRAAAEQQARGFILSGQSLCLLYL